MWYRKDYPGSPIGTSDALDMIDEFKDYYADEQNDYPDDARGLALFQYPFTTSGGVQWAYSKSLYHDSFFAKHGFSLQSSEPFPVPEFIWGDEGFAKSLSSKK